MSGTLEWPTRLQQGFVTGTEVLMNSIAASDLYLLPLQTPLRTS